jgi:N-methylhydantoinase A
MAWRIGVGSGGTVTDVCPFDEVTGTVGVWKVPSTPSDPSQGIAAVVLPGSVESHRNLMPEAAA